MFKPLNIRESFNFGNEIYEVSEDLATNFIDLDIFENWGQAEYTCFYGIEIFGYFV